MSSARMRRFWDRRAREDPFYFVDNRLEYGSPDLDRFWSAGAADLDAMLGALGVAVGPTDSVVEIGCGVGRLTRVLASRAAEVRALDVSPEMLAAAREHNPGLRNVDWILGDGSTLRGIGDAQADACVSHVTFQHIPDPAIVLGYVSEMGRVLRPGGWAAFQFSNDPAVHRRRRGAEGLRIRLAALTGRGPRGQSHPAWLGGAIDLRSLERTARAAGMDIERLEGAGTIDCKALARRRAP